MYEASSEVAGAALGHTRADDFCRPIDGGGPIGDDVVVLQRRP